MQPKVYTLLTTISDMKSFAERLLWAIDHKKTNQSQLAKAVGISRTSINKWVRDNATPSSENIFEAASYLGVSAVWLSNGDGDPIESTHKVKEPAASYGKESIWEEPDPKKYRTVKLMRLNLSAGITGAAVEYFEDEDEPLFFKNGWFDKRGIDPEKAAAMKVSGESMEPLLSSGDTVLVNTEEQEPRHDKVFAVCIDGELVVKRLLDTREGWELHSDNPMHKPRPVTDNTQIIGRVRWIGRDEF